MAFTMLSRWITKAADVYDQTDTAANDEVQKGYEAVPVRVMVGIRSAKHREIVVAERNHWDGELVVFTMPDAATLTTGARVVTTALTVYILGEIPVQEPYFRKYLASITLSSPRSLTGGKLILKTSSL